MQEWPLLALTGLQYVTATYGPFAAQAEMLNSETQGNQSAHVVDGFIISAHLISDRVSFLKPQVVIVFHASRQLLYADSGSGLGSSLYRSKADRIGSVKSQQLCLTAFVKKNNEELAASCIIDDASTGETCVANLSLPYHWWHATRSQLANVHYSAVTVRNGRRCSTQPIASEGSKAGGGSLAGDNVDLKKVFVAQLNLAVDLVTYEELKEDQHVLINVPVANFSQGSVFRVPIKLQAESNLQTFVMR